MSPLLATSLALALAAEPIAIERSRDGFAPVEIEPPPAPEREPATTVPPEPPASDEASEATSVAERALAPTRCVESRRCRGMRIAGSVIGVLGVGATVGGIVMLVRPDEVIADEPAFVTSTKPAGLVTTTLGVGVTLTAALILVASGASIRSKKVALGPRGLHF